MKMLFTGAMDLKLIRLVKTNPTLYDNSHPKYNDFNAREVVWQMIGDELKRPATECKERWINIRDVHRRLLKKRISDPRPKYKPYKYEGELTFMLQYYKDITVKNAPIESDVDDDKPLCEDFDDAFASDVDSDSNKRYKKKAKKSKASKKKIKLEDVEKQTETAEFDAADPIDAFLLSIGATLKTFSAYHLNLAKSEIFNVVQQHDLQQIVQRESNDSLSSHVKVSTSEPIY